MRLPLWISPDPRHVVALIAHVAFPEPGAHVLERFVLERPLASGAMGEVWVGRVRGERDKVAIKLARGTERDRAGREAEALSLLDHPGIVGFVTAGEEQDHAVLVMELVDGVPLSRSLKSNPPTPAQAIDYARQVCEALVHAHGRGVVHRDVKASNLLLSRGLSGDRLVLIDFGLGLVEGGQRVSSSDVVLGSVHTMPPEQLAGETSDGRADVYSLASLLFRMLSGHYPFHASSSVQVLAMHAHAKVPELRERIDAPLTVPRDLPELVTRCLQKAPDARPDADTLLGALSALPAEGEGAWVTIQPDVPAPEGRTREEEPPVAITPLGVALGGLAVAVVVVALWWML